MEVIGKVILALPEMSGVSKSGNNWHKREYVIETLESFPRKIHFDFFGDKADQYPLTPGQTIRLSFDIESREYNGRWFTSIRGWKAEPAENGVAATPAGQAYPDPRQAPVQGFPTPAGFGAAPAAPAYGAPAAPAGGFPTPPAPEAANDDLPF